MVSNSHISKLNQSFADAKSMFEIGNTKGQGPDGYGSFFLSPLGIS